MLSPFQIMATQKITQIRKQHPDLALIGRLLDAVPHPCWLVAGSRNSQKIIGVNPAALQWKGLSRKKFLALDSETLIKHLRKDLGVGGLRVKSVTTVQGQSRIIEILEPQRGQVSSFIERVLDSIEDMVFVKEAESLRFVAFNRAGEKLLGYKREQLIGKNDYDFFPKKEADFFTNRDRQVMKSRKSLDIPEEEIHDSKGRLRYLHTRKIPIYDSNGKPLFLLGMSMDITAHKRVSAERKSLRKKTDQLKKEHESREKFISMLAHDLRGVLAVAKGSAELIMRAPVGAPLLKTAPKRIVDGVNRAERLLRDLLDVERYRAGQRFFIEPMPMELKSWLDTTIADFSAIHGDRFQVDCAEPVVEGVWGSEELRRILENLVNNALKYGDKSQKITIRLKKVGEVVRLVVHNRGSYIAPSKRKFLFEAFQRVSEQDMKGTMKSGWGLGLIIVKSLAEAHGGTVFVESSKNDGTLFGVELPIDAGAVSE